MPPASPTARRLRPHRKSIETAKRHLLSPKDTGPVAHRASMCGPSVPPRLAPPQLLPSGRSVATSKCTRATHDMGRPRPVSYQVRATGPRAQRRQRWPRNTPLHSAELEANTGRQSGHCGGQQSAAGSTGAVSSMDAAPECEGGIHPVSSFPAG
jgi:hypothetical protein